ncbi:MAG: hypothetical protein E1N59_1712 [Puniceicoccaceae bacterium 5H]|nr:MAG: hypothetical protein E1N59_1712 [Puniceicoccaceae bacterium 5H]
MKNNLAILLGATSLCASVFGGFKTTEPAYLDAQPMADFDFEALMTTGDRVPMTGATGSEEYTMVGIPDASGIYVDPVTGENIMFMAHELTSGTTSQPIVDGDTYIGSLVSRWVLDDDASIVSGGLAHQSLYMENAFYSPEPPKAGDGTSFTRFCSGSFAGPAHGMDRPIFITNEESTDSFDAQGPQSVAIFDGEMHTLPALGRVVRENTVVQPRRDRYTVVVSSEDGGFPSYVYMYVGTKARRGNALDKNGFTGGKVYVLGGSNGDAGKNASTFTDGSINVEWIEVPNAASLDASQMKLKADEVGGYGFVRVEDMEFDPQDPTRRLFVATTGGYGPNRLGRLYEVHFNPRMPWSTGSMEVIYNADQIVTPGGSIQDAYTGPYYSVNGGPEVQPEYTGYNIDNGTNFAVSIDNIAVNDNYIVICEDTNSPANAVYAKYGRNGGVWTLDRNNDYAAKFQSQFNLDYVEARDNVSLSAGRWEATGVIDASTAFGPDTFLIEIQAHGTDRTNAPDGMGGYLSSSEANTRFAEDGQLLIMRPRL